MKIVLFDFYTNGHHLKYGGEIIKYLKKKNYEVMLIVLNHDERVAALKKQIPNLKIKTLYAKPYKLEERNIFKRIFQQAKILKLAFKIATDFKADVFHLLYLDSIIPLRLSLPKNKGFKFVVTSFWLPSIICRNPDFHKRQKLYNFVNGRLLRKLLNQNIVDGIFGHNVYPEDLRQLLADKSCLTEENLKKISFIYDPIYEFYYKVSDQKTAREKLILPKTVPILLMFGELTKGKGLDILIEAIKKIKAPLCLVIAGKEHFFTKEKIDEYKKELADNQQIIDRLGFVDEEDLPYYFLASDALMMPYRKEYAMGTSGVLMQAVSAKRPTIASDVGAIGALIKERNLGLVVKAENPAALAKGITKFLSNRKKYSVEVEKSVGGYLAEASWSAVSREMEGVYKSKG